MQNTRHDDPGLAAEPDADREDGDDRDEIDLEAVERDQEAGRKEAPLADDPAERVRPVDE